MTPEKWQAVRIANAKTGLKWSYVLLVLWIVFIITWIVLLLCHSLHTAVWFGWFWPVIMTINLISILLTIWDNKRIIAGKEAHSWHWRGSNKNTD